MCKQMDIFCTPKSNAQNMLLCLKRAVPRLYATEGYLNFFTEQDFIDIMKSDKGALVLRLYCVWWVLTINHVLANPETLFKIKAIASILTHGPVAVNFTTQSEWL